MKRYRVKFISDAPGRDIVAFRVIKAATDNEKLREISYHRQLLEKAYGVRFICDGMEEVQTYGR